MRHRRGGWKGVKTIKPGQFVIGSFFASDNTCPHCRAGCQTPCQHREFAGTAQAPFVRIPLADGTLMATPEVPPSDLVPSLLTASHVMGTGWFAAESANVRTGSTVVVIGDGAVGLLGVLSVRQMGAERIIAMSRHESRQRLAREFGATDIVTEDGVPDSVRSWVRRFIVILRHRLPGGWLRAIEDRFEGPQIPVAHDLAE